MIKRGFLRFFFTPRRIWALLWRTPRKTDVFISFVYHMILDPRLMTLRDRIRRILGAQRKTAEDLLDE